MILEEKMQIGIRDFVADAYATEVAQVPHQVEPDAQRIEWDRNFRICVGSRPEAVRSSSCLAH